MIDDLHRQYLSGMIAASDAANQEGLEQIRGWNERLAEGFQRYERKDVPDERPNERMDERST